MTQRLVDHHIHWSPPACLKSLQARDGFPRTERTAGSWIYHASPEMSWPLPDEGVSLEAMLADLDANGVHAMLAGPSMLGEMHALEPAEAVERLTQLAEELSQAQTQLKGRLFGLAMLPLHDPASALAVLDDTLGRLGLAGVSIPSNVGGEPVVSEQLLPVYERIEQLGAPVVMHPAARTIVADRVPWKAEVGIGWLWETSVAALSFIYSGVLDRCPELQIVHPHLGGVLPYLLGRILAVPDLPPRTERRVDEYLRQNFYVDSVGKTPGAVRLAIQTYGANRIVFGSDTPYWRLADELRYLRDELPAEQLEAILDVRVPLARRPV